MKDAHMIAVSLLYDIAIFSYSTVVRKWFSFNQTARYGYICLLNSSNHTDILLLHGTCDSVMMRIGVIGVQCMNDS